MEVFCEEICGEDKPRAPAEVSGELGNVDLDVQLAFGKSCSESQSGLFVV
jgi:hypothetical protein